MTAYYAIDRNSEYLEHYGVLGMKWGVIHDTRNFNSAVKTYKKTHTNNSLATASKYYKKLQKHSSKINAKQSKNNKKLYKYGTKKNQLTKKYATKIGKYTTKKAKYENKAYRATNESKYKKYSTKAREMNYKLNKITAKTAKYDGKYNKTKSLDDLYNIHLNKINDSYTTAGKSVIKAILKYDSQNK